MFPITYIPTDDKDEPYEFARQESSVMLQGKGWIGEGSMAGVYGNAEDDYVIKKIAGHDSAYFAYLLQVQKSTTNNPYFPKILETIVYTHNNRPFYTFVKLERLSKIKMFSEIDKEVEKIRNMILLGRPISTSLPKKERKFLTELIRILKIAKNQDSGFRYDLHNGNWMLRDKQIVLIDPLI